ncbi:MAG: hypothetical protein R3D29_15355 [Nitratireductor sp.]
MIRETIEHAIEAFDGSVPRAAVALDVRRCCIAELRWKNWRSRVDFRVFGATIASSETSLGVPS